MADMVAECIEQIKERLEYTCTPYEPADILVIEEDGVTFVLGNPILGEEAIYDEFGKIAEYVPMRNVTLVYLDTGLREISRDFTLKIPIPWVRVLRPDLCMKIVEDEITDAGVDELQDIVTTREVNNAKAIIAMLGQDTFRLKSMGGMIDARH